MRKQHLFYKGMRLVHKIQGKRCIHFLHIRKTGGTAIRYALQGCVSKRYVVSLHGHGVKLRDLPRGEGVIFFVRDPVTRFVSGFYSRKREGRPRHYSPWRPGEEQAFSNFSSPNELAVALSSKDREERLRAIDAMENISHLSSHYWDWFESEEYFRSRLSDIFFIGFQETLNEDFERLKAKLGLIYDATLPTDATKSHRTPLNFDRTLNATAIRNLRNWYREDYEFVSLCQEIEGRAVVEI